ncbi:MAG: hypothetical protein IPH44_06370 [Myxococcales bacterium]|nr:hypothetical protein [Myxococcales bacterium]MBK7194492.1 hypothetical protein [Myxococcales bacterium]
MLSALRILILAATIVATSGIATAYASCDEPIEHVGGACDDETCPPGAVCSTCPGGSAIVPSQTASMPVAAPEPRVAAAPAATWQLVPNLSNADIFHPPRVYA